MQQDCYQDLKENLIKASCDGWLLYDFRRTNDLACTFLKIPPQTFLTRRFFYWIPAVGDPIKIVHRIEAHVLNHLPGRSIVYSSWEELDQSVLQVLKGFKTIAMEYSPFNAIPYVSKVDGGTIDMVRRCGVNVVSSAVFLQKATSVWTQEQLNMHLEAADVLDQTVEAAWQLIAKSISAGKKITEKDVQSFILDQFSKRGCVTDAFPICAVNAHSADPHYSPGESSSLIQLGDFVLIDLWCKRDLPLAVYADITRVGVVAKKATERQQLVFNVVKEARDAAMTLLRLRLEQGESIQGCEVDKACRDVIIRAGFGNYFTHRTGHNIGERDHGEGANIDSLETNDVRELLPATCFSIEPGIYLPGEFGVRLEHDVYIEANGRELRVTGGLQEEIKIIIR